MKELESIETYIEILNTSQKPFKLRLSDSNVYCCKYPTYNTSEFLLKEYLGSRFCNYLNIDSPSIVSAELKQEHITESKIMNASFDSCLCFRWLKNVNEISRLSKFDKRKIKDRLQLLRILLFDLWILNTDRNSFNPNLLIKRDGNSDSFIAIDHGMAFFASPLDTFESEFKKQRLSVSLDGTLLGIDGVLELLKNTQGIKTKTKVLTDNFITSIEQIILDLDEILDEIPTNWKIDSNDLKLKLLSTIFDENWYKKHIIEQFLQYLLVKGVIK